MTNNNLNVKELEKKTNNREKNLKELWEKGGFKVVNSQFCPECNKKLTNKNQFYCKEHRVVYLKWAIGWANAMLE